jgi:hypothetical protein
MTVRHSRQNRRQLRQKNFWAQEFFRKKRARPEANPLETNRNLSAVKVRNFDYLNGWVKRRE